jgi:hypothetical protein
MKKAFRILLLTVLLGTALVFGLSLSSRNSCQAQGLDDTVTGGRAWDDGDGLCVQGTGKCAGFTF